MYMNKLKGKKSQMEIIGLAIIVAIALIGMFFAIKYLTKTRERSTEASDKQIASSFINTLLSEKFEIESCKQGIEMKELIKDCTAQADRQQACSSSSSLGATLTYCQKARESTQQILNAAFGDQQNIQYEFKAEKSNIDGNTEIWSISRGCSTYKNKVLAPPYVLPTDNEPVIISMGICS